MNGSVSNVPISFPEWAAFGQDPDFDSTAPAENQSPFEFSTDFPLTELVWLPYVPVKPLEDNYELSRRVERNLHRPFGKRPLSASTALRLELCSKTRCTATRTSVGSSSFCMGEQKRRGRKRRACAQLIMGAYAFFFSYHGPNRHSNSSGSDLWHSAHIYLC